MDYPFNLGTYSCPVTCREPAAQIWFDRGLMWTYGFNHAEAIYCFQEALAADPDCAMAYWGISYAAGPNYNMPWELFDAPGRAAALATAFDAAQEAQSRLTHVHPWEEAMIRALARRYPQRDPVDDMGDWDDGFADAMRDVFKRFDDILDIRAIFVEALMNRTPWKMWDIVTGLPAEGASTLEAQKVCEDAFENDVAAMQHPGLLHLYVHLMEMSPVPETALPQADILRTLVPDAGHLIHMPSHIDVLCGHYHNVVHWNRTAIAADERFWRVRGAHNIYTGYRLHNYHFLVYGALFLGQLTPAVEAVRQAAETVPEDLLRIESPPMADYFESCLSFGPHVLVRFGMWDEAAALEPPEDQTLFCTLTAHVYYARGIANAALGNVAQAEREEQAFLDAMARVPASRLLHNAKVVDLLAIAKEMLRGEIAYRRGDYEQAFAALRQAVYLEDNLPYDEPWGWMQPVRHALGALLFEQGRVAEAEAAFREDLGLAGTIPRARVHPDNVWALRGLHDCLTARGGEDLPAIRERLKLAEARADRRVAAACFCAQRAMVDA